MIVKYKRLYPVGPYLNEEIGFEIELDTPDPIKEVEYLKNVCDEAHKKLNPHLYVDGQPEVVHGSIPVTQVEKSAGNNVEVLIPQIEACTEIEGINGISSWRKIVEANPILQDAYDRTRKKIIGKETKAIFEATDALLKQKK